MKAPPSPSRPPSPTSAVEKPPYQVPLVAEIRAIEPNGLRVVSTFSGCGGSSLGFRMSGYRVVWASEFIEEARRTYEANAEPGFRVDGRDIRTVKPEEILRATGLREGELDVFEGSPPCASFSTAGKREKYWGATKTYSETKQRTDDLFFEYVRLLRGLRPRTFVAENVAGLLVGTAKGYFLEILRELRKSGYRVGARLLDAQYLGVPQVRRRVIFVGLREDVEGEVPYPKPLPYRYTVREALSSVPGSEAEKKALSIEGYAIEREWAKLREGGQSARYLNLVRASRNRPCPTVTATAGTSPGTAGVTHPTEARKFTIPELKRISGFPDDFELTGTYKQRSERLGRAVPPPMMAAVARELAVVLRANGSR